MSAYPAATTPRQRRDRRIELIVEKLKKGKRYSRQSIAEEFGLHITSGTFYFQDLLNILKTRGLKYVLIEERKGNMGPATQYVELTQ